MSARVDPLRLQSELQGFTGTSHWYRCRIAPRITYTDGIKYLAEQAGGYWLLDILATELPKLLHHPDQGNGMLFITMTVKDGKARIVAGDGDGNDFWLKRIPWTDFPEGEWKIWMGMGGPEETDVIMLPSEY